jgi:glycosyltransferase involved in cell wall biosynthesis
MKIAFINARYAPHELGGAERVVRGLAEAAVRRGHRAYSISLARGETPPHQELNGVRTYYVPLANIYRPWQPRRHRSPVRALWHVLDAYNPIAGRRVERILAADRPDVIQTNNLVGMSVSVWAAAERLKIPVVQMLHDYYLVCANSTMFRDGRNCARQCGQCHVLSTPRRLAACVPQAVISVSRRTLQKVQECGMFDGDTPASVIHGVSELAAPAAVARARAGRDVLTIGYLGRIERTKGVETLLDALSLLQPGTVRLLVAGTGSDDDLRRLKAHPAANHVTFLGYVSPGDLFEQIDLLVVPSVWEEPLGRVIPEAYAYGIPVAVARVGGMPEIVEVGKTGFTFEPNDARGLAALLAGLATHWSGDAFRADCRRKAEELTIEHTFDAYQRVWADAVEAYRCRREASVGAAA